MQQQPREDAHHDQLSLWSLSSMGDTLFFDDDDDAILRDSWLELATHQHEQTDDTLIPLE